MIGQEFSNNLEKNHKHILQNFNGLKSSIENQWKYQISEIDINQLNTNVFYDDNSGDGQKAKQELIMEYLVTIVSVLQFTRLAIDLGFTDIEFNSRIYSYIV